MAALIAESVLRDTVNRSGGFRPFHALAAILLVGAAGAIGSFATLPAIPTWYASLAKPPWTPPNAVFGPAWTTLYLLMAIAFYRVLGQPPYRDGRPLAVGVFVAHMVLNGLWSVGFFGLRAPAVGLADIALLLPVAIVNILVFARLDRVAGWLMAPNALWVSFAAALNLAIWRMN